MTATERRPVTELTAEEIEAELRVITPEVEEALKVYEDAKAHRVALFLRGRELGLTYRDMGPWAGLTNSRVHQIVAAAGKATPTVKP